MTALRKDTLRYKKRTSITVLCMKIWRPHSWPILAIGRSSRGKITRTFINALSATANLRLRKKAQISKLI